MKRHFCFAIFAAVSINATLVADDVVTDDSQNAAVVLPFDDDSIRFDFTGWDDPAFNRMVDFALLGDALASGDASAVMDIALNFAEAERILLRNHPKVQSTTLLKVALVMAQKSNDKATLSRLTRVAEGSGNETLRSQVQAAAALGGKSRAAIASPAITIDIDPAAVAAAQAVASQIEIAENTGDAATVNELRLDVVAGEFPESISKWLSSLIDRAEASVGEGSDATESLTLLAAASRFDTGPFRKLDPFNSNNDYGVHVKTPFRPYTGAQTESSNFPMDGQQRQQRQKKQSSTRATPEQMKRMGYRQYGNVKMDNYRNVIINGKKVGQGTVKKNRHGKYYVDFQTKNGGRIIKQGNGQIWVQRGLEYDNVTTRRSSSGRKNLGTFNTNSYRQNRYGN